MFSFKKIGFCINSLIFLACCPILFLKSVESIKIISVIDNPIKKAGLENPFENPTKDVTDEVIEL